MDPHKPHEQQNIRRVTHRDIAKALGLSKATISLALRNHPRITETTRLRVHEKAAEMNYQPDPMLSALSNYRSANQGKGTTETLAWINFYQHPEKLREQKVFDLYWEGAHAAARKLGFHLEEFRWKELPLHRMHSVFKARGIRGIVLPPALHTEEPTAAELDIFPWKDYAIIRLGESLPSLKVNYVSSAQVSNTIQAFERMREKGYQRVGFIGVNHRKRLFSAGYLWAQETALPRSRHMIPLLVRMEDLGQLQPRLEQWLEQQKPDAIICSVEKALEILKKMGVSIPSSLGLAALSHHDNPINAGIDQNPEEIGRTAIRTLVSQLNENSFGIPATQKEILVAGHWVDGSMLPQLSSSTVIR